MSGVLTLVATPIGNLGDMSDRARDVLRAADIVAAEDTRRTRKLLSAFEIPAGNRLVSYNRDNSVRKTPELLAALEAGRSVALVSDAGVPGIADPGAELVAACHDAGVVVTAVPGASSVTTAVALAGFGGGRFCFETYLPRKGTARRERIAEFAGERRAIVLFESPHRIVDTLADLAAALGDDRECVVCRELTKMHEQVFRGTLGEAVLEFVEPRGEFVVVLAGTIVETDIASTQDVRAFVSAQLASGASVRDSAAAAARTLGVNKRAAYAIALEVSARG